MGNCGGFIYLGSVCVSVCLAGTDWMMCVVFGVFEMGKRGVFMVVLRVCLLGGWYRL